MSSPPTKHRRPSVLLLSNLSINLPNEYVLEVLSNLPLRCLLNAFTVSTSFANMANSVLDDRTYLDFTKEHLFCTNILYKIHRLVPNLRSVSITVPVHISTKTASALGGLFATCIRNLKFVKSVEINDQESIFTRCFIDNYPSSTLKWFHCCNPHLFIRPIIQDNLDETSTLSLQNFMFPSDFSIDAILSVVSRIGSLLQLQCSAEQLAALTTDPSPSEITRNLEVLKITDGQISPALAKIISNFDDLTRLEIMKQQFIPSVLLHKFHFITSLAVESIPWDFEFFEVPKISKLRLTDLNKCCSLIELEQLEEVVIHNTFVYSALESKVNLSLLVKLTIDAHVSDSVLSLISSECHALREISLRLNIDNTASVILAVLTPCVSIELHGSLPDISSGYDHFICKRVKRFVFANEGDVLAVEHWLKVIPFVKHLELQSVNVSYESLVKLEYLHVLTMHMCSLIVDESTSVIWEGRQNIHIGQDCLSAEQQFVTLFFRSLGLEFWSFIFKDASDKLVHFDSIPK
ncbi:hypothetical protein P9112_006878 [Eukaryota sp. TZLM1-RC]